MTIQLVGLPIVPDGIEWHQLTPDEHSSGRFWQQNFLIKNSGPSPYAEVNVCAGSSASTVHHIRKCSVTEAHRQMQNQTFAPTVENRRALLLLCTRGELQEKETCHCTSFGLKNGVCRCAKQQWLEIAFVKLYAFFVLM